MSIELPKIGIGTWQLKPPQCKIAVLNALKVGYCLIDTAQGYRNEQAVGEADCRGLLFHVMNYFLQLKFFLSLIQDLKY